jgi:hypothetical protein
MNHNCTKDYTCHFCHSGWALERGLEMAPEDYLFYQEDNERAVVSVLHEVLRGWREVKRGGASNGPSVSGRALLYLCATGRAAGLDDGLPVEGAVGG